MSERRPAALRRVLATVNRELPAAGAALFWPSLDGAARWRAEYAGKEPERVGRWIRSRLNSPLEEIAESLPGQAPRVSGAAPEPVPLGAGGGLCVLWGEPGSAPEERLEPFRRALELFVEVERLERLHFHSPEAPLGEEATRELKSGDEGVMTQLLSLARNASGADFAYWGSVHDGVVDVEWQLGAGDPGFGFELPVGEGVGGRVFARDRVLEIPDYLNCRYRYPEVSDITDSERVRSVLAVPVHGAGAQTGAVLYAVRREVSGFLPAQRSLLQRLCRSIEPVQSPSPSRRLFPARGNGLWQAKSGLRRILAGSEKVQDLEAWLERTIGGPAILTDHRDRPYLLRDADRLERLRNSRGAAPRIVPFSGSGSLYLWPAQELDLRQWPDFIEDVAVASSVVVDRAEQGYHRLNQSRSRWIRDVMGGRQDPQLLREGNRLSLPAEGGEVWAISWSPEHGPGGTRGQMLAEDIGLDQLGSPLVALDDAIGVFLLKREPRVRPAEVRDELLRAFDPGPLWLAHGAAYERFEALGEMLAQAVGVAERARRQGEERYVAKVKGWGLDSLLDHPRLSAELSEFGESLLEPLISYDRERGSRLTETFCLSLTLDSTSEVSRRLFVHENTVRYRLRRAQQILGRDLGSSKDRIALGLAAFVWLRRGP